LFKPPRPTVSEHTVRTKYCTDGRVSSNYDDHATLEHGRSPDALKL